MHWRCVVCIQHRSSFWESFEFVWQWAGQEWCLPSGFSWEAFFTILWRTSAAKGVPHFCESCGIELCKSIFSFSANISLATLKTYWEFCQREIQQFLQVTWLQHPTLGSPCQMHSNVALYLRTSENWPATCRSSKVHALKAGVSRNIFLVCSHLYQDELSPGEWPVVTLPNFPRTAFVRHNISHVHKVDDLMPPSFYDSTIDKYCRKKSHQQSLLVHSLFSSLTITRPTSSSEARLRPTNWSRVRNMCNVNCP